MHLVDDNAMAHGMIRVAPGEDLLEALEELAKVAGWKDAFVTGTGLLELVELDSGSGDPVTLENAQLTQLAGRVVPSDGGCKATLQVVVTSGGRFHTGRIREAVSGDLLLIVDAVVQPAPKRVAQPVGQAQPVRQPAPRPSEVSPTPPKVADSGRSASKPLSQSFKTKPVVHKITRATADDTAAEEDHWMDVEVGDFLQHPQLGFLEAVGDDPSGGTRIRLPGGRVCVLRLDTLLVLAPQTDDEGRRVFKITGPRKRK